MTSAIEKLRSRHPWPSQKPASIRPVEGWLDHGNKRVLARSLSPATRVVVELGSWLGLSARYLAEKAPNAVVVCVDTWQGSREHTSDDALRDLVARLYDSFLGNTWDLRNRIVPIRALSWDGLEEVHAAGVRPDLIYVDASHAKEDVERDLETAIRLFPDAVLLGDDWSWASVRAGVLAVAGRCQRRIRVSHNCYEVLPASAGPPTMGYRFRLSVQIAWRVLDQQCIWPVVRVLRRASRPPNRPR